MYHRALCAQAELKENWWIFWIPLTECVTINWLTILPISYTALDSENLKNEKVAKKKFIQENFNISNWKIYMRNVWSWNVENATLKIFKSFKQFSLNRTIATALSPTLPKKRLKTILCLHNQLKNNPGKKFFVVAPITNSE